MFFIILEQMFSCLDNFEKYFFAEFGLGPN